MKKESDKNEALEEILEGPEHELDELHSKLDGFLNEAARYREQFRDEWEECERFYAGRHWRVNENKPVKNWVFSILQTELPVLVSSAPGVDVIARDERMDEQAKVLDEAVDWVIGNQNGEIKVQQAVLASLKTGTGWLYVDYDPDLHGGDGAVIIKPLDWRNIFCDPSASELDECSFVSILIPTRKQDIARRYDIDEDEIEGSSTAGNAYGMVAPLGWDETKDQPIFSDNNTQKNQSSDIVALEEHWFKDYDMEDIPEEVTTGEILIETDKLTAGENPAVDKFMDHAKHTEAHLELKNQVLNEFMLKGAAELGVLPQDLSEDDKSQLLSLSPETQVILSVIDAHIEAHGIFAEQNPENKRPKYDNFMHLVIRVGKTVLYDGSPDLTKKVPLVPFYGYKEDGIYGTGEVKNILAVQKSFNDMDYAEYLGLRLVSNPGWVMDQNSGVDPQKLTNDPGIVVVKQQGTEVSRLAPGQVSPQLQVRKDYDLDAIQRITGINEVSQGIKPASVVAARAIERLMQLSNGRMRLKARNIEAYSVPRLGELIAERIVRYWTQERILRVYDASGKIKSVVFNPKMVEGLDYEIRVATGTTAGIDKESIHAMMLALVDSGKISVKTFFESTDLPYKQRILDDIAQNDQNMLMMQQLTAENEQLKAELAQVGQLLPDAGQSMPMA